MSSASGQGLFSGTVNFCTLPVEHVILFCILPFLESLERLDCLFSELV